jgi:hypothetical protein
VVKGEDEGEEKAAVVVRSCAACVVRRQQPEMTNECIPARYDLSSTLGRS